MTISFKVSENTKQELIHYFEDKKREKTPPYAVFQAKEEDTVVTLYESGKVVFQGVSADIDAALWKQREKFLNPQSNLEEKEKKKKEVFVDPNIYYSSAIGSDEVGTGDYFGPIVVTACFVDKEKIAYLESMKVKDSKKMTDEMILQVVPKIIKEIPYQSFIFTNEEYNKKYSENLNMNKIKAILHNKVLSIMKEKYPKYDYIIIDEFAPKYVYYHYLKDSPNVVRDLTFLTKGEDKSLAVACASLISRFIFLKEYQKLEKQMGISLPKGAGLKVDEVGAWIAEKFGKDKLKEIAKLNFKNTDRILEKIK